MKKTTLILAAFATLFFTGCNNNPAGQLPITPASGTETTISMNAANDPTIAVAEAATEAATMESVPNGAAFAVSVTTTATVAAATAETTETTETTETSATVAAAEPTQESEDGIKIVTDTAITIELPSGPQSGRYSGEAVGGLPHGKGKFITKTPEGRTWYYEGDFEHGCFAGEGAKVWDNGHRYEGIFIDNELNGFGRQYRNDELVYAGLFSHGVYGGGNGILYSNGDIVFDGLFAGGIPDEQPFKELCEAVTFEDVARRPEYYYGRPIILTGKAIQVVEIKDGMVDYRIATRDNRYDVFYIGYDRQEGEARVLEDDIITVWGICRGMISYESELGGTRTIPGMMAYYLKIENLSD